MRYTHLFLYAYFAMTLVSAMRPKNDCLHPSRMTSCFTGVLRKLRDTTEDGTHGGLENELSTIKQMCRLIEESKPCVVFRLTKCSSWQQPTVDYYINSIIPIQLVKLCNSRGILEAYSLQGPCLIKHQSKAFSCVEKGPGPLNASTHLATLQSVSSYCRSLSKVFSCGWETLEPACGNQTVDLFIRVVTLFLPSYVTMVCLPTTYQHGHQGVTSGATDCMCNYVLRRMSLVPVLLMTYNTVGRCVWKMM